MTLVITHTLLFFTKAWHVFCVCGELRSLKVIKTSLGPAPDKHVSWHNPLLYLKKVSVTAHHVDFNHASLMTGGRPLRRERLSDSKPTVWCCSYNRRPFRRPWVSRSNQDPLCLHNSSLYALQNLQPWAEENKVTSVTSVASVVWPTSLMCAS